MEKELKGRPLHERVIVEVIPVSDTTSGGIYLPEESREIPTNGIVKSIGNLVNKDGEDLQIGDHVLFIRHSGFPVMLKNKEYRMILANDIIFVYDQEIEVKAISNDDLPF